MGQRHKELLCTRLELEGVPYLLRERRHGFLFGKGPPEVSKCQVLFVAGLAQFLGGLLPFVVSTHIPLLGSLGVFICLGLILDLAAGVVRLNRLGVSLRLVLCNGHLAIDIADYPEDLTELQETEPPWYLQWPEEPKAEIQFQGCPLHASIESILAQHAPEQAALALVLG